MKKRGAQFLPRTFFISLWFFSPRLSYLLFSSIPILRRPYSDIVRNVYTKRQAVHSRAAIVI